MTKTCANSTSWDEARLRSLAARRLLPAPTTPSSHPSAPSDFDLNPDVRPTSDTTSLREAAVLIPILAGDQLRVLLTERTSDLPTHPGQIAFPGGKIDSKDGNPLSAAFRETEEEVGIEPKFIEPLGYVEPYTTGTGFLVTPVVAMIRQGFSLRPDAREVASVFEVPLDFLLDERNHRVDTRSWRGADRRYYAMPFEGRYIWGVTAGIIRALHRRLTAT